MQRGRSQAALEMKSIRESMGKACEASDAKGKEQRLRALLREMDAVIVAFSGGVDSTYVACVAAEELGERALCVTGLSASLASHERAQIEGIVQRFGLHHETVSTEELDDPRYRANSPDRCYFCKTELYEKLTTIARARGIEFILDGSTLDDLNDHRPGRRAAGEHGVRSPLIEVGMTKAEVRERSLALGLPTWDKPASPCLSSRIAYGLPVTVERLRTVERGEEILRQMGLRVFRVRHHGDLVRLEIAREEMDRILNHEAFAVIGQKFRALGFRYVTLDLDGFRSGAMNEALRLADDRA